MKEPQTLLSVKGKPLNRQGDLTSLYGRVEIALATLLGAPIIAGLEAPPGRVSGVSYADTVQNEWGVHQTVTRAVERTGVPEVQLSGFPLRELSHTTELLKTLEELVISLMKDAGHNVLVVDSVLDLFIGEETDMPCCDLANLAHSSGVSIIAVLPANRVGTVGDLDHRSDTIVVLDESGSAPSVSADGRNVFFPTTRTTYLPKL